MDGTQKTIIDRVQYIDVTRQKEGVSLCDLTKAPWPPGVDARVFNFAVGGPLVQTREGVRLSKKLRDDLANKLAWYQPTQPLDHRRN